MRGRALPAFFLANVLFGAGLFAHAFLYNFYLGALGAGEAAMGNAAAALTAGGLVALAPAGIAVDRLGARRAYAAAAVLAGAGLVAGAFVETRAAVWTAAFAAGAGTAAWRVAMGPLVMALTEPGQRERAFSWNVGLLVGSGALWTAAAGAIPERVSRWAGGDALLGLRVALLAGAAGTLLSGFVLLAAARRDAVPPPETRPRMSVRETLASLAVPPHVARLVALVGLWMVASGLVIPFFNLYFRRAHELPVERIGVLFAAAQAVTAVVVLASGEIAARRGARAVLAGWLLLFAPALWGLTLGPTLGLALALFLVQGFVPPATNPLIDQLLLERAPPERRGAVSSWRGVATEGSGFVAAAVGGVLLERGSFALLFGVSAAVGLVAAVGLLAALRAGRTRAAELAPA